MQTEPITINVSAETAEAFRKASPAVQRQIQDFLEFALMDEEALDDAAFEALSDDLESAAREMGTTARERGLDRREATGYPRCSESVSGQS